jgi:hypothetical protein
MTSQLAPAAERLCVITKAQLIKRCKLEGIRFRSNVRIATLLDTANAHGLLALAPEPQVGDMYAQQTTHTTC